jgi:signal transduction histidine kinase
MNTTMTHAARAGLTDAVGRRYRSATGKQKRRILDEFVATTGSKPLARAVATRSRGWRSPWHQSLAPLVRDEIYRIAREAVRNAAEHAQARRMEAELAYGKAEFVLRVRDDGVGVDPQILKQGRARHWGLQGMRERAEGFGARFNVWTKHGAGTEIELLVPARICYGRQTPREV